MDNCSGVRRCLICHGATLQNSSTDPENFVASLLQDFLNCFHINVLDSEVNDLSTSCQFCPTCEQFLAEWSSIQTQMTQLTRRAAQLKATLSALLLSAPQIQDQNHDEDVTEIINKRIKNSQEIELPLLLQQTVHDIRNELQRKYSVKVMVDKIQLPCPPSQLNEEELVPLLGHSDNDEEPVDDWSGDDHSDAEYLPSEDQMDDEETSDQIAAMRVKPEEEVNSDSNGHESSELKAMMANQKSKTLTKVGRKNRADLPKRKRKPTVRSAIIPDGPNRFKYKGLSFQRNEEDQTYTCDTCGFKSLPKTMSIKHHLVRHLMKPSLETEKRPQRQKFVIPDGPNAFKYNGHGLKLNDEDQCYYCDACQFKGTTNIHSVLNHIRVLHYTEEDKLKFTAVKTSDTEWLYGGEYKITGVGEKFKCVLCGSVKSNLQDVVGHIRAQHIGMQDPAEVVPLPVTDAPSVKDSTPIEGVIQSVPYTFDPFDNKYTCGICQSRVSASRRNFSNHIRVRHTDAALKVICEVCGKELINQHAYKLHLKKHQAEPKKCPSCDKRFYDDRNFQRHLKVHAFGEAAKKHQCEYCGKRFLLPASCRTHVMIHTGEKPYECDVCGKKFRTSSVLSKHRHFLHGFKRGTRNLMRINE